MQRITPDEIALGIRIQLGLLPKSFRHACGVTGDRAIERATEAIMTRVLAGTVVVRPDPVSAGVWGQQPGRFGETEPWPPGCDPAAAASRPR